MGGTNCEVFLSLWQYGESFADYSFFTCCDLLDESDVSGSGPVADRRALLRIMHWALVKHNNRLNLKSKFMQEVHVIIDTCSKDASELILSSCLINMAKVTMGTE